MHVLLTTDTVGGVWIYTRELATGLVKRGVKVTLVSFGEIPSHDKTEWMEGLSNLDFRPTAFPLEWMHGVEKDMAASEQYLLSLVAETKPDLLHFNQYYYGAIACDVPRMVVAHSDVLSWWTAVHGHAPPPTQWLTWYRKIIARSLTQAAAVVAPSQWMLDYLKRSYGAHVHGSVIHNGRSPKLFNPHVTKEPFAVSVGRLWDSGKQVTLLCRQGLPLDCYIAGSDRHPDASLKAERSLATDKIARLHFKGEQSEEQLRQLYGRAAVYAATSRYEPFGLSPVEAALSRCALVANDIPSFRELWGDAAMYFERNSSNSLMTCLETLAADPALARRYANAAYERALRLFNADRMVDDYLTLYRNVASSHTVAA